MEVILKDNVKGLGYKNDIVKVKPGFARNYLIPQGVAIAATESNKKIVQETAKQQALKAEKIKQAALSLSERLAEITVEIRTKAGESGKIFGAVTALQVADVLKERGFDVDRRDITFTSDIKNLGNYQARIDLHKEVKATVKVSVVQD